MVRSHAYKGINGVIQATLHSGSGAVRVARVQSLTINLSRDLFRYYEVGKQTATEIMEGRIEADGTLNKAIWDGRLLKAVIGDKNRDIANLFNSDTIKVTTVTVPTPHQIPLQIVAYIVKDPLVPTHKAFKIIMDGVKINRWTFTLNLNAVMMENIAFWGTDVTVESADSSFWESYNPAPSTPA